MKTIWGVAGAAVLAFALTGCGSNANASGPAPTPTVTVTVTATVTASPPAPPVPAEPMALGTSAPNPNGGTVTVYEHRKGIEPQDPNQEAVDVKVCVGPKQAGETSEPVVSLSPWAIYDAQDRRYTAASSTWEHAAVMPAYPVQQQIRWGDCVRGWVIIEGAPATPMTKVRYTAGSTILEWKLTA